MGTKEEETNKSTFRIGDLFGLKASFNFRGDSTSRSTCGVCSTILFGLFCLWSLYHVGKDIVYKEHPETIQSIIFVEDPEEIIIGPNTFILLLDWKAPRISPTT